MVFIDESGLNLALTRLYARALKGQRARDERPNKRGRNVSTIGATSEKEVIASVNILGAANRRIFEAFIITMLVPKLWKGAHVVVDNSTIHQGSKIETAIEEVGAKLIFLTPYSPEFNPIENLWSKVKSSLRSQKQANVPRVARSYRKGFRASFTKGHSKLFRTLLLR